MVTLVPAKQWQTCLPVATHLFSPPSLQLYPSIWTLPPVLHRALSPSPTHTVLLSLFFFVFSHWGDLAFLAGQRKWWQWLRNWRDSWTVMDLRSCCMCSLPTPSAPLSHSGLISSFHCLLTLPCFWYFHLIPIPLLFLVSILTSAITPHHSLRILSVAHLFVQFLIPQPTACFSLSAVRVSLFPLDYVVRAPAVDYESVDSQRAAKASSTNMRQYSNDWLVGSGPWKQASVSAWARLGPQVCP